MDFSKLIPSNLNTERCSEASPDDFGALAGKVSDKSVVFRPTALCSIRSAMMQLVRDRKLGAQHNRVEWWSLEVLELVTSVGAFGSPRTLQMYG